MLNLEKTREELIINLEEKQRQFIANIILSNQKIAEELKINTIDLQCLNIIEMLGGEAKPSEISKMTGLTTGGVTVMLDRLEKKNYIERVPNPNDRRSIVIHISSDKKSKLEDIYKSRKYTMEKILTNYDDQEISLILDYYTKLLNE
ncbi:MarR family winged helix-turn-helix transcriptional regulator [Methanobacterium sp.]|uniref:MarR family winged helix-turn-helix transcriptional regulator n=1 Tax=Methanobacterium sp. TaxID=2164 RepID=UPI003C777C90